MKINALLQELRDYINSSIQIRITRNFGMLLAAIVAILEVLLISFIYSYYYGGVEQILKDRVTLSSDFINKTSGYTTSYEKVNSIFDTYLSGYQDKFYIQLIDKDKMLIRDSNGFSDNVEINAPDVNSAITQKKLLLFKDKNKVTNEVTLSASRPLIRYNNVDGVLRFTVSLEKVNSEVMNFVIASIVFSIFIILFFIFISVRISRQIINPLEKLNTVAREFASGNFEKTAEKVYQDEVGELADTMNFMAEEIKKSEKLKTEFISSISHELRTPLTSIKGWSETLQMSDAYKKDSDIAIGLNIISTESERLSKMVEELLDFSRFQANTMKVNRKPVNIKGIIFQVYRQFSNQKGKEVDIKCRFKGEDTIIFADENRLKQIYINLITNSIKFTKKEDGKIDIIAIGYDDKIVTVVKDNGVGIKKENLAHVTEKFYKGSSTQPGSGLGLSIVDELVKLQDGEMKITSKEGYGTAVVIIFPAIKKLETPKEQTQVKAEDEKIVFQPLGEVKKEDGKIH